MLFGYVKDHRPIKIKSVKELQPGFKPKWFRICIGLFAVVAVFAILALVGVLSGAKWVASIAGLGGFVTYCVMIAVVFFPKVVRFLGYWWPQLELKASNIICWLEHDLDWRFY